MYELTGGTRPREKLLTCGVSNLTDRELIAVLLGSGIRGRGIDTLAGDVLTVLDASNYEIDPRQLLTMPGLGKAKASLLAAAFELAKRLFGNRKLKIRSPQDAYRLLHHQADRKQEHFFCLTLNGAYELLRQHVISVGLINKTMVHPREVFSPAIEDRAAAIICAHNHPSGNPKPSAEDRAITRRLRHAGKILGIPLLDHLIFTTEDYFSFQALGQI